MDSTSTVPHRHDASPSDHRHAGRSNGAAKVTSPDPARQALARLYGPVIGPLADVEKRFTRELQSPYESLMPVLRHGTQLGGKRLRPAMLLLSGAAVGELTSEHNVLATVIEMLHTATLVHDDVLDEANTRRHVATVNARWNNHTSILLGDYLFSQGFRLAASLPSTEACQWIGEAARLVCEGELRQILQRDELSIDEDTYLEIIRGKTAELCRVACQLGAKFSGGDESSVHAFGAYGDAVGVAFQIADDYLDLWGEDVTVGKTLGTDIAQGKTTLPIIRLLQTSTDRSRNEIIDILTGPVEDRVHRILPLLNRSDAADYTRSLANEFRNRAIEALVNVADCEAKKSLAAIADFSVDRRF